MSGKSIELVGDGRVRVSGDVTLADLYGKLPSRELYVEPLSETRPLSEFLAEGGLGFGSLRNGTFAGQLCRVSNTYEGAEFSYGLGTAPLYNVGYPLQRIMEGRGADLLEDRFGAASEMVLRTRERRAVTVEHLASETCELPAPDGAENVFFVNVAAAGAMDLSGAGVVKARASEAQGGADVWSKRFVLDGLPEGHERLAVLTQPSGAKSLCEAHRAKHADGLFLALAVHSGVLVVASAPAAGVDDLASRANSLPLTWRLGGAA